MVIKPIAVSTESIYRADLKQITFFLLPQKRIDSIHALRFCAALPVDLYAVEKRCNNVPKNIVGIMKTKKEKDSPLIPSQQTASPSGSSDVPIYKCSSDPRDVAARNVYKVSRNRKSIILHKVTRAGATTSIIKEFVRKGQSILVVEPTNQIIDSTIYENMKRYGIHVVRIPSNKKCPINEEKIKEHPILEKIPYIYLPTKCADCSHFNECQLTEILRTKEPQVIAITYDKLTSLMLSEGEFGNSTASEFLAKILKVDYVFFDEVHELQYEKMSKIESGSSHYYYMNLMAELKNLGYPELRALVFNYIRIINSEEYFKVKSKLSYAIDNNDDSKVRAESIPNPFRSVGIPNFIKKTNKIQKNKKTDVIEKTDDIDEIDETYTYKLLNDDSGPKIIYSEIIDLSYHIKKSNISFIDILILFDMLNVVASENITIEMHKRNVYDDDGKIIHTYKQTYTDAINFAHKDLIKNFTYRFGKRVILSSATICSYDYDNVLPFETHKMTFGKGGDPMNTNSKYHVFVDTKTLSEFGRYSLKKLFPEKIYPKCKNIFNVFGVDNCMFICKNKDDHHYISDFFEKTEYHPHITYYKATDTVGVECEKRVIIALGLAYKPKYCYDAIRGSRTASCILNKEAMHTDTYQSLSRCKDPDGRVHSFVFIFGARYEDARDVFQWGLDRQINIDNDCVSVSESLNPIKVEVMDDWKETITKCLILKLSYHELSQKAPFLTDWQVKPTTIKAHPLKLISNDVGQGQLNLHIKGKITLEMTTLQKDNRTNFILYESEDKSTSKKLMLYLNSLKIPYILEKQKYSMELDTFKLWIFIEAEYAFKVKKFALEILKVAGIQYRSNGNIRLYPMMTNIDKDGNCDKLSMPFGKYSSILVDGEFTSPIEMDIGIITIPSTND